MQSKLEMADLMFSNGEFRKAWMFYNEVLDYVLEHDPNNTQKIEYLNRKMKECDENK